MRNALQNHLVDIAGLRVTLLLSVRCMRRSRIYILNTNTNTNEYQLELEHCVTRETLGLTTDHFPFIIEIPSANIQDITQTIFYRKIKDT